MDWNRISRLLPMLSSDKQGEVIAAVNAIGRVLAAGGGNWHDLAKRVDGGSPGVAYGQEKRETKPPPYTKQREQPNRTVYVVRTWGEMVEILLIKFSDRMSKWERDFCLSLRDQLRKSPSISPKQDKILTDISDRFGIILS